jgi:hypothetical protein
MITWRLYWAPRSSPCLRAEVGFSTQAWSPRTVPTYAPGRWSASVRKRQGFGGSSSGERNPPKHGGSIAARFLSGVTHSSTAKALVFCVGGRRQKSLDGRGTTP